MRYLTPGQRKIVEDMEKKITHVGFKTKMRGIYIGRKEVFKPARGIHAMIGAISQYNIPSANSIVPMFSTETHYWFGPRRAAYRKRLLMKGYKKRKIKYGANPFVLNSEELATIWHFPMSHVKTPLLQKTEGKKAEPPAGLPMEYVTLPPSLAETEAAAVAERGQSYQTDSGDVVQKGEPKFG
jgi:hypothetical protein